MNHSLNENDLNQLNHTLNEGDFDNEDELDDEMTYINSVIGGPEPAGTVIQQARPQVGNEIPVPRIIIPDDLDILTPYMGGGLNNILKTFFVLKLFFFWKKSLFSS